MAAPEQELLQQLQALQSQIKAIEEEELLDALTGADSGSYHVGYDENGNPVSTKGAYQSATPGTMKGGQALATSGNRSAGHLPWVDGEKKATEPVAFYDVPCANGVNCLDENFCYDTRDCPDCEVCRNYECVSPDPNATCQSDRDCPCNPNEDQHWDCVGGECKLTCRQNSDCSMLGRQVDDETDQEICFACNPRSGYCGPGCQDDGDCNVGGRAADAGPGTFCIDCECKTPCDPPEFCTVDADCKPDLDGNSRICEEHTGRARDDGSANTGRACVQGCRTDDQCPLDELIDEDGKRWTMQYSCVDKRCEALCSKDDDCFPGESCVESRCQNVGELCIVTADCEDEDQICTDGRCTSGCRTSQQCNERAQCPKEPECLELCPYDQTCQCTEGCDEDDWSWIESCPKDPACVAACPDEEGCEPPPDIQLTCFKGECLNTCSNQYDCPDNGKGWKCGLPPGEETEPPPEKPPGPCDDFRRDLLREAWQPPPKRCLKVESDDEGPIDDRFGCDDLNGCCSQNGQCSPCVCSSDAECDRGGVCVDGECAPGCDEENPCPEGQCCGPDSKCHLTCTQDSNCPDPEMCLAGGCCGIACEPLVFCNVNSDCPEGEYCDGDNVCQSGCERDEDCEGEGEICWQFSCEQGCQDTADCNRGSECESTDDCGDFETCSGGYCMLPEYTWDTVCNENGFCESANIQCCFNDGDCGPGQELDDDGNIVRTFSQICKDGQCSEGCATDSQCPNGISCVDNQCKRICLTNADCPGRKETCTEDGKAYREQLREVAKCHKDVDEKQASGLYDPRTIAALRQQCYDQAQEVEENRAQGYCQEVNPDDPSEEGRTGCECWEECDDVGRCVPILCAIDEQCPCGSCLTSGTCGDCMTDADCPGRQKCDRPEICDDEGENCVVDPEQGGECVFGCLPPEPCVGNADCPNDTYCGNLPDDEPDAERQCITGCRDDSNCPPAMLCDQGTCVPICTDDSGCNSDYERCDGNPLDPGKCIYVGWSCEDDGDCPPDLGYCRGGKCIPDSRCVIDDDCDGEDGKCTRGFCDDFDSKDPYDERALRDPDAAQDIGCESCAECCTSSFLCAPCPCTEHADCPCGVCTKGGICKEECQTNADCVDGYCKKGECVECIKDQHCWVRDFENIPKGQEQFLQCSQNNVCETPCFTGLSSGSCFEGLNIGDTCQNCPDKCPDGASCQTNPKRVCGLNKKWDPSIGPNGDWSYTPILCVECYMPCDENCDCPEGHICTDGGCITSADRCSTSADCPCETPDCRLGRCREIGDQCIAGSDCEPKYDDDDNLIPQVCEFGYCKEGTCSEEYPCGQGQTCVDGTCFNSCNDSYMACGQFKEYNDDGLATVKEVTCPPGYVCDVDRCVSEDYLGLGEKMGCGSGKFCDRGGCVPIEYGVNECGSDDDCNEPLIRSAYMNCRQQWGKNSTELNRCVEETLERRGRVCDDRLCRRKNCAVATGDDRDGDCDDGPDKPDGRDQEQDSCEPRGLCCNDQGFCAPCECSEENPCKEQDECCDSDTGKCIKLEIHQNTRFGAPYDCTYHPVFCQLLDPEENEISPTEDFNDPTVPGCEPEQHCEWDPFQAKEVCIDTLRCWTGAPLNDDQIRQELAIVCNPRDELCSDGCGGMDDMPPEVDECQFSTDCGKCQRCIEKFWRGDECCPLASEIKYFDPDTGEELTREIDGIYRNVCVAYFEDQESKQEEYCQCESNDDCTECEYCDLSDTFNGNSSNYIDGDETFGKCKLDCDLCPCGGDSSTKEGACKSCSKRYGYCAIEGEKVLKEEYVDPETGELVPAETACACVIDRENDCCEAYTNMEMYRNYKKSGGGCIRKEYVDQNGINRIQQVAWCLDSEEGICAQCMVDSDCGGFQQCYNGQCIGQCGQENSTAGESEYGFPEKDCTCCSDDMTCREIYESWTESTDGAESQLCRPCTCTENGIDCADFIPCEGCYKWVRSDGSGQGQPNDELSEAKAKTQQFGLEQALFEEEMRLVQYEEKKEEAEEELIEADGELGYWHSMAKVCQDNCEKDIFGEIVKCNGVEKEFCLTVPAKLEAAAQRVDDLTGAITDWDLAIQQSLINMGIIYDKIAGTQFTYGSWTQVRQCDCCVDGQCRSDEDCTYGTCFLCIEDWTGWYGVGIWGIVLQNPVCMGMNSGYTSYGGWDKPELASSCPCYECPDPGTPDAGPLCGNTCERSQGGPQFVHYELVHGEDACVQYRCRDGISTEERLGSGTNQRYYEYCTGSIIGCLIGGDSCRGDDCCLAREYLNGWKFEYKLEEAGLFVGNYHLPKEDWIKLSGVSEELITAECMYPNRLGHVRGHELPTFEDMLAGHPCCNKGEFWYQCDPEHPGCQTKMNIHYQAGDVSGLIKRLTREHNALTLQIAYAAVYWWQLEWEIERVEKDIEELEEQIKDLNKEYKQLKNQHDALIERKGELEEEVEELDEKINNECATKDSFVCEEICEAGEPDCREECREFTVCDPVWNEETQEFEQECRIEENCTEICIPTEECRDECEIEEVYKEDEENGLMCKWEHYQSVREDVGEEQKAAIEVRDEKQEEINASKALENVYYTNYDNAKKAVNQQTARVNLLVNQIQALEDRANELDCDGDGGELPECVDIDLQLNAPGGLNEQLSEAQGLLEDYRSQQFLWYDTWQAQKGETEVLEAELEPLQEDVDDLTDDYQNAYSDELEAREELDEAIGELTTAQTELKDTNAQIEVVEEQLEQLDGEIEICKQVPCKDPGGSIIAGCYEEACEGDGAYNEQVKKLEEVIESYRDEQKPICDPGPAPYVPPEGGEIDTGGGSCSTGLIKDMQDEQEAKREQIEKLKEDDQKPTVPTLVTGGPPDDAKTSKQLQEAYKEQLERDKEKLENPWYP